MRKSSGEPKSIEAEIDLGSDRKSTRLNSSHGYISYAVFCLKKKNTYLRQNRIAKIFSTISFGIVIFAFSSTYILHGLVQAHCSLPRPTYLALVQTSHRALV